MPLRDHFRPPFSDVRSWEEVQGQWPAAIVQHLGKTLPAEYAAGPHVHLGPEVEIDVATFEEPARPAAGEIYSPPGGGGVATAVWARAEPTLAVETEFSDFDEYEVRVYDTRRGRDLPLADEILRNKGGVDMPVQFGLDIRFPRTFPTALTARPIPGATTAKS